MIFQKLVYTLLFLDNEFKFFFSGRIYVYKCPKCRDYTRDRIFRHLELWHNKQRDEELTIEHKFTQSKMRVMYLWCQDKKHGTQLPLPCELCLIWVKRLDKHLNSTCHRGTCFFLCRTNQCAKT